MALHLPVRGQLVATDVNTREWQDRTTGEQHSETDRVLYVVDNFQAPPRRIVCEDLDLFAQLRNGGPGQILDLVVDVSAVGTGRGAFNLLTLVEMHEEKKAG